jgi:tetratricopeptide (TPR) repeat protein
MRSNPTVATGVTAHPVWRRHRAVGLLALVFFLLATTTQAADHPDCPRRFEWPWAQDQVRLKEAIKLLARGDNAYALAWANAITTPENLIAMAADKRFDAVASRIPRLKDISGSSIEVLFGFQQRVRNCPRSLRALWHYQTQLLDLGRFEDTIRIARDVDQVLQKRGPNAYVDSAPHYSYILTRASTALVGIGSFDQAVRVAESAVKVPEQQGPNVTQQIMYARLLIMLGRTDEARARLNRAPEVILTALGTRVGRVVELDLALQRGDLDRQNKLLEYLATNRNVFAEQYQCALVNTNQLDRAAAWLIERLRDPDLRTDALLRLQEYSIYDAKTTWSKTLNDRWQQLASRPDVLAAANDVGRIHHYGFLWRPTWLCEWPR